MKLIVGLGNPGRKYEETRHNVGFITAAKVASLTSATPSKVRFEGELAEARVGSEKVVLLWPQTYMNASGQSIRKAMDFYKLSPEDLLVISDDLDLAVGRLRFKRNGSAGGQKGIADTIRRLRSDAFGRLKIGIGRPPSGWETADYVLGKFAASERDTMETITTTAARAAMAWVTEDMAEVMCEYNSVGKPPPKPKPPKPKPPKPRSEKPKRGKSQRDGAGVPSTDQPSQE